MLSRALSRPTTTTRTAFLRLSSPRRSSSLGKDLRRFTREHEWILPQDGEACAKVGLTPYAVEKLGDVVYVELPTPGSEISQNAPLGNVESVKAAVDVYAPVSGTVADVNTELEKKPNLLNKKPLEAWLCTLKIKHPQELSSLMDQEEYQKYTGEHP